MMSAYYSENLERAARTLGADGVLEKPVALQGLQLQ
jgi:hypothetical protein